MDKSWEVREQAALLLGSFVNVKRGRDNMLSSFVGLHQLLNDETIPVREAAAWAILRLSFNRDGCELIVNSKTLKVMVISFIRNINPTFFKKNFTKYFLYLFQAFVNLTQYDNGIVPFLGTGATEKLKEILAPNYCNDFGVFKDQIQEL